MLPRKSACRRGPSVRLVAYSRSACLVPASPPLPRLCRLAATIGALALAAIHPPAPDADRCQADRDLVCGPIRSIQSKSSNWERRRGRAPIDRALFWRVGGLYSRQLNKWITGFAPPAKQIRRDPSWPPLPALAPRGIYIAGLPCHAFIPYDTKPTAAAAQARHSTARRGRNEISDQCKSQRVSGCLKH